MQPETPLIKTVRYLKRIKRIVDKKKGDGSDEDESDLDGDDDLGTVRIMYKYLKVFAREHFEVKCSFTLLVTLYGTTEYQTDKRVKSNVDKMIQEILIQIKRTNFIISVC